MTVTAVNDAGSAKPNNAAKTDHITGSSVRDKCEESPSAHMIRPIMPAKKMNVSTIVHVIMISFLSHL